MRSISSKGLTHHDLVYFPERAQLVDTQQASPQAGARAGPSRAESCSHNFLLLYGIAED